MVHVDQSDSFFWRRDFEKRIVSVDHETLFLRVVIDLTSRSFDALDRVLGNAVGVFTMNKEMLETFVDERVESFADRFGHCFYYVDKSYCGS